MSGERRGIQSVEVGGQLLRALADAGVPMMLKELAAAAGMTPAKAHPYLVSFGKLGLVEQDPLTGRYKLGAFALRMGLAALHALNPVRVANEVAAQLADEVGQNVAIAVWGNLGATVVDVEECQRAIHVNMRPGTVMGLLTTATGRVFAAYLPPRLIEPLIERELQRLAVGGQRLRISRRFVEEQVAEVRRHAMARVVGQPIPGINAFSAPVFDHNGHLALALTVLGPEDSFDPDWDGPMAQAVRRAAQTVTERVGGDPKKLVPDTAEKDPVPDALEPTQGGAQPSSTDPIISW
ncbi:MAG TPA: IclR family transcriptional regulator [Hydrogenophilus thermoluteolus]|nr:IclR family transcriptional regulator [Hydrogenophilus thermoluteolus]